MERTLIIIIIVVTVFAGFLIGFSIPPYVKAGVFSERKEKGVKSLIDKKLEQHYKDLYNSDD